MATDAWPSADAEAVDPEKVTLIRSGESENSWKYLGEVIRQVEHAYT